MWACPMCGEHTLKRIGSGKSFICTLCGETWEDEEEVNEYYPLEYDDEGETRSYDR